MRAGEKVDDSIPSPATATTGRAMAARGWLLVAYVSYLGLGVQSPSTDWGGMLSAGLTAAYSGRWWLIVPPGLAIILVVCAFNAIGDGLRDAFDVKGRG